MNADDLKRLGTELDAYAALSRPPVNSVLVLQHGTVISEHYWHGFSATSRQSIFSVTKSFVSALVGLAIADGKLTLSDMLVRWFPELNFDPKDHAASVTIQHLLTMTSGFRKAANGMSTAMLLKRPSDFAAGEKFRYSNEDVNLLAILLERAIDEPLMDYTHTRLFEPLGIWRDVPKSSRKRLWKTDKQGHAKGGYGLYLTTRELGLFGQLYLQAGKWQDAQLIPPDFVDASTRIQVAGNYPEFLNYGYLWWLMTDPAGRPAFFASGLGGQYVCVFPALDLVIVITSNSKNGKGLSHRVMIVRRVIQMLEAV